MKHATLLGAAVMIALMLAGCGGSNDPKFSQFDPSLRESERWDIPGVFAAINRAGLSGYMSRDAADSCFVWKVSDTEVGMRVAVSQSEFSLSASGGGWTVAAIPYGALGTAGPISMVWCAADPDGFVYGQTAPETYPEAAREQISTNLSAALSVVNSGGTVKSLLDSIRDGKGDANCTASTAADTSAVSFAVHRGDRYGFAVAENGAVQTTQGSGPEPRGVSVPFDGHPYDTPVRCTVVDGKLRLFGLNAGYLANGAGQTQTTTAPPTTTAPEQPALPTTTAPSANVESFQTPSGNIKCDYPGEGDGVTIECDIQSGFVPEPPRPADCDYDWGTRVSISQNGAANLVCTGNPLNAQVGSNVSTLEYGQQWSAGGFTCASTTDGLRCTNKNGHGFFLSREGSALLSPGGTGTASAQVVIATEIFEDLAKWLARPLSINLAMGVRTLVSELHWSSWGGAEAKATGVTLSKACVPDCASSNSYTRTPTRVVAFDKRKCANGFTAYTRIRVSHGSSTPYVQRLLCP